MLLSASHTSPNIGNSNISSFPTFVQILGQQPEFLT